MHSLRFKNTPFNIIIFLKIRHIVKTCVQHLKFVCKACSLDFYCVSLMWKSNVESNSTFLHTQDTYYFKYIFL